MREMSWHDPLGSWACSECGWVFRPVGPPVGVSLDEMKQNFESQRDKEFASHVCAQHPKAGTETPGASSAKRKPRFPRDPDDPT